MTDVPLIFMDPRPIRSIWYDGENAGGYCTVTPGYGVAKIVAYQENGQCAPVPFYAVYDLYGNIKARVPAQMVTVVYDTTPSSLTGGEGDG